MPNRFQFTLRTLLGLLTLAAVIAWGVTLVGIVNFGIVLFLMSPLFVGVLVRRPLEGCLANVFLLVVFMMGGFVVAGLMAD